LEREKSLFAKWREQLEKRQLIQQAQLDVLLKAAKESMMKKLETLQELKEQQRVCTSSQLPTNPTCPTDSLHGQTFLNEPSIESAEQLSPRQLELYH
jgi:hypothetical protein